MKFFLFFQPTGDLTMRIKIEDGTPIVELLKSETAALHKAREICVELAKWLDNEDASATITHLDPVIEVCARSPRNVEVSP